VTSTNIDLVRNLIEENIHITYEQIEAELSLNPNSIHEIIHIHLKMRKITSRWVPYELTDAQKERRVNFCKENLAKFNSGKWQICDIVTGDESWVYYRAIGNKETNKAWVARGETPQTVQKRNHFEPKSLISIFFKSTGLIFVNCLESGKTITAKYYRDRCLKPTFKKVMEERPNSGLKNIKILHDNAKSHVAKIVETYLNNEGITIIDHPPYSPDLAPCDFWLFSILKQSLDTHRCVESLKKQITEVLESIPKEEYLKTFQKYLERMQLCIDNHGEYFEHLI